MLFEVMNNLSGRPKTCRECKQKFVPKRVMQPVCERYECMTAFATKAATKARKARVAAEKKREKAQRDKVRKWKDDNQSISDLTKKAQAAVNSYIKYRDHGKPCISCKKFINDDGLVTWSRAHAGHFRSTAAAPNLRFNVINIRLQCARCNIQLSGNHIEYRKNLVDLIGLKLVEQLESDNEPKKYSKDDLRRIAVIFRKRARWYKRRRGFRA